MTSESTPFLMLRDGACEIYLIRHGDATPTEGEVISATYDEQALNSRGRAQAEALARRLATVPFAALYSSPLRRALDTAQPLSAVKALPVEIVPDVREIMHSAEAQRADGMSAADYIQRFKEGGSRISAHMMRVGSFEGLPGVEPRARFRGRVRDALDALAARHPGQRIAVVTHGGVINVFAAEVLGLERDVFMAVPNTAISRFRLKDSRRQLVALNDTCHLRDLARTT
jgi:2,3-bisphosphoglycerate-dependent phosphoglycerate mutase